METTPTTKDSWAIPTMPTSTQAPTVTPHFVLPMEALFRACLKVLTAAKEIVQRLLMSFPLSTKPWEICNANKSIRPLPTTTITKR